MHVLVGKCSGCGQGWRSYQDPMPGQKVDPWKRCACGRLVLLQEARWWPGDATVRSLTAGEVEALLKEAGWQEL